MKNNLLLFCKSGSAIILILFGLNTVALGQATMGIFEQHGDIGDCKLEGGMEYCVDCQVYELEGSGENMWFDKDQFHFVWKKLSGDFIIRARIKFIGDGVNAHRKMGLMIRSSLSTCLLYTSPSPRD